jgi:diguanylate cyclase (GGDEF)-like protein/PAS domain S-box-containing protein
MKALECGGFGSEGEEAFADLVKGYDKLLRQSSRLVTMGDRMQQSLNELNSALVVSEEKYRGIFENVTEGIFRCWANGDIVEVNPAMAAMFGFKNQTAYLDEVGNICELFCNDTDFSRYQRALTAEGVHRFEVKACGPRGIVLWAEISASVIYDDSGSVSGVVGVLADVTERKHMIEEMCRLARTDSLTGLWNRGYFMELAVRELNRADRNGSGLALFIVDADHFKGVNDTYGHDVGDKALIAMSQVLLNSVRDIDLIGRLGGEEFVIMLPDAKEADACCVAERILKNMRQASVDADGRSVTMTVSIGLAALDGCSDGLDGLLKSADIALYAAKKNGRDRVEIYRRAGCPCRMSGETSHMKQQGE